MIALLFSVVVAAAIITSFYLGVERGRQQIGETMDERRPGEAFCASCPDHEACMSGYPCSLVKRVASG